MHGLAILADAGEIRRQRVGPERESLDVFGRVGGERQIPLVGKRARRDHDRVRPADLLALFEGLSARAGREHEEGHLRLGGLELGDLRAHVRGAALDRLGGGELEPVTAEIFLEGGEERLAVLVVLIEHGERLVLPLAHEVVDHHA